MIAIADKTTGDFLPVAEIAELTGIPLWTVRRLVKHYGLPSAVLPTVYGCGPRKRYARLADVLRAHETYKGFAHAD